MAAINIIFHFPDGRRIHAQLRAAFTKDDVTNLVRDKIGNICHYRFLAKRKEITSLFRHAKIDALRNCLTNNCNIFVVQNMVGGCFLPETLVMCADKTQVSISTIKPGDKLLAFNDNGEIVTTSVQEVLVRNVDDYIELQIGEDNKVFITPDHWVYAGKKSFTQLKNLCINDSLFILSTANDTCSLSEKPISSLNYVAAPSTRVYNLHTDEPHTYFANGLAVHNMSGNLGVPFVDVSNNSGLQYIKFSQTAPRWRIVKPGLCLEGKCLNESCVAHKEQVFINIGYKQFNVLTDANAETSKCPVCSRYVEPSTCGFTNCLWRWWGIKKPEKGLPPVEIPPCHWNEVDNEYVRFDEERSGTVTWQKLILEASSKYKL